MDIHHGGELRQVRESQYPFNKGLDLKEVLKLALWIQGEISPILPSRFN